MALISFGGYRSEPAEAISPNWVEELPSLIGRSPILATGMGKSYGDVASNSRGFCISSNGLNRMISFDESTGALVCEPGVLLHDIQKTFVNRGWMLPVTPGTAWVTVAGAIANDVHGKDHHSAGTFGDHTLALTLARSDGSFTNCSPNQNGELFKATIGGLGLTGLIVQATISLKRVAGAFFDTETIPFGNLSEFFRVSQETEDNGWQASVGWFDSSGKKSGRGIFTRGNHSSAHTGEERTPRENAVAFPFQPPISLVNPFTLKAFNSLYFKTQQLKAGSGRMHYQDFYYPLDGISNWNRIYGPKGFFQYQSVLPMNVAADATQEMLEIIKASGQGSFLAVLKTFADRKPAGLMSFARHGVTLAIDFPNRGEKTFSLMNQLDRIVETSGGALNPSKDARMSREMFELGFPQLANFKLHRDPAFSSDFSRRLID